MVNTTVTPMPESDPGTGMPGKSHQIAFVFDEDAFTFSDVLIAGALRGEWGSLVQGARTLDRMAGPGLRIASGQAAAGVVGFRRAHRLEAASDLQDWLRARDLTTDDLICFARAAQAQPMPASEPAGGGAERWWAQAVFSGALGGWADALQRWVTASRAMPAGQPQASPNGTGAAGRDAARMGANARQVAELTDAICRCGVLTVAAAADEARVTDLIQAYLAYRAWAQAAIDEPAIDRLIGRQRIAWTWLEFDEVIFSSDSAAREAMACVAEDNELVEDVAARAGALIIRQTGRRESLLPEEDSILMTLQAGQIGGPLRSGGAPTLLRLRRALVPVPDDEAIRKLARAELIDAALSNAAAGRVRRVGAW